ncbi:4017_t:CDS:2, partial [Acaulospora morrowiae]
IFLIAITSSSASAVVPGVQIIKPDAGSKYKAGDKITITFCSDPSFTKIDNITLYNGYFSSVQTFELNVTLAPKKPCHSLTYKLSKNLKPDAQYNIAIITDDKFVASSATFFIGNPKFGLVITSPDCNVKAQCGKSIAVKWENPFNLYKGLKFDVFFLSVSGGEGFSEFAPAANDVPVSPGYKTVTIPKPGGNVTNSRGYNVVFALTRPNKPQEIYISDAFSITHC